MTTTALDLALSHYSDTPFVLDRSRDYVQDGMRGGVYKPDGLWVSVDGEFDWAEWCEAEEYGLGSERTNLRLTAGSNVLVIDNEADLRAFSHEFRGTHAWMPLDWARVATIYDGVIISPYQWGCRFDLSWYYGWDCASGCIWNLDAVE